MPAFLIQAASQVAPANEVQTGLLHTVLEFLDTPAPYSPFSEYLAVLFLLWLLARRESEKKDFAAEAQKVLDEKYQKGEINKVAYEKYRQELSMRIKKE